MDTDQAEAMAEDFLKRYEDAYLGFFKSIKIEKGKITADYTAGQLYKEKREALMSLLTLAFEDKGDPDD